MSSNFPNAYDDDSNLPPINDNITDLGEESINAVRDAIFNIEHEVGLGGSGSSGSIAARLGVSIGPDGYIRSSALTTLGLVTLPITNSQIIDNAQIPESKLSLDYKTIDLYNYILELSRGVNSVSGWISVTGTKLEPHLMGAFYRHTLSAIDVADQTAQFLNNKFRSARDNSNAYTAINDLNSEFLSHQWADGSPFGAIQNVFTNNGSTYPSNYGHTASGIYLQSGGFVTIPQTVQDIQTFADYIDSSGIFLYGTRIQNLYSNGISRKSSSSTLNTDGYGQAVVPVTAVTAFLRSNGAASYPVDSIFTGTSGGDDLIEFQPSSADLTANTFDAKFAQVKSGDILRINYGTVETQFVIKEKLYTQSGSNKNFVVRIAGKNLLYTTTATARIDRPLYNINKYGVLSTAAANYPVRNTPNNTTSPISSLIVSSPRAAQALGVGFNPDQLDSSHYALYLALYPTGNPNDGYVILPSIDVTGNQGTTPGSYTLSSVVNATNNAFRMPGFNYRFTAFSFEGQFGVMLADSYNNASFSILSGVVNLLGAYDPTGTAINFTNNVVDVFPDGYAAPNDPLGFGPTTGNMASPPYMASYGSAQSALVPTKLFVPLKRNNYYVDGAEKERLTLEVGQIIDGYGDGYWEATIDGYTAIPGPVVGRVPVTYFIPLDLSASNLKIGKTLVVQSLGGTGLTDYGRFIIEDIEFVDCSPSLAIGTRITVYDGVHATGISPFSVAPVGTQVAIYFNSDSVSFNLESATDSSSIGPFKRHFEVYVNQNGETFTHERGRMFLGSNPGMVNGTVPLFTDSSLNQMNFIRISPKLRGYQFGFTNKITLLMSSYDSASGIYDGYLANYNGTNYLNCGPLTFGKRGQVTRFYDETNVDYIDVVFDLNVNANIHTISSPTPIDFQLFPTLSLDEELMLLSSCQLNDSSNLVDHFLDQRQFGNISEEELSTSALSYLSLPEKLLHGNGIIRGFDLDSNGATNPVSSQIYLTGGLVLSNGKFIQMNADTVTIPLVKENYASSLFNINWLLCVNDKSEYQPIPLLDFDPALSTPNNPTRLVSLINVNNGSTYLADATTFSDLINNRKDLTPLYIIAATVIPPAGSTPASISLSLNDVRKYINDGDTNLPLQLTTGKAQGNFKNASAIFNWIKYNNTFNSVAIVKGANSTNGTVSTSLDLNSVLIDGENNATLTMNGFVSLGSNLTIKNTTIIFNGGVTVDNAASNINLINCNIIVNNPSSGTPAGNNITFNINNCANIKIDGCNFTINYTNIAGPTFTGGAVFYVTNTTGFTYENCQALTVTYVVSQGVSVPGDVFIIRNSPGFKLINSGFSGNFNQFVRNTNSSNMFIQNIVVTSTYTPYNGSGTADSYTVSGLAPTDPLGAIDGLPSVTYNTALPIAGGDLVNTGRGCIYSNVAGTLDQIIIDRVIFTCNQPSPTAGYHRFSFINFELTTNSSILSNTQITNCQFRSNNTSSSIEDVRPAIAIINTSPASISTVAQPIAQNLTISNNSCNRNQSILLTSKTNGSGNMVYPGLSVKNGQVSNNTCGTIGHWTSSGLRTISTPPNVNPASDKTTGLNITNNTCHYIASLDHTATYFLPSKIVAGVSTNFCAYPTGYVNIKNNSCNWIHTGISFEETSSIDINNNYLVAYDINYITSFKDGYSNADGYVNAIYNPYPNPFGSPLLPALGANLSTNYAIFVGTNRASIPSAQLPGEGNDSAINISSNITATGYWLSSGLNFNYQYALGYIFSQGSCTIQNNNLKGVAETSNLGNLILVSGLNNIITGNKIYRNGKTVSSYVLFANYDTLSVQAQSWNGFESKGIVTGNIFDSPFCDNATLNTDNNLRTEAVVKYNTVNPNAFNWTVTNNKNQTGYLSIPLKGYQLDGYQIAIPAGQGASPVAKYFFNPGAIANGGASYSLALGYHDAQTTTESQTINLNWLETLDSKIPIGTRPVLLQLGFKSYAAQFAAGSFLLIEVYHYNNPSSYVNLDYFTTSNNTQDTNVIIPANSITAPVIVLAGALNTTPTIVNTIDFTNQTLHGVPGTDQSRYFVSGQSGTSAVNICLSYSRLGDPGIEVIFSPLFIKYRW
jgi:hypothetical protein